MLPRLDYLALCRSIQLLLLLAHSESAKDLELPEELKDEVRELLVTLGEDPTARRCWPTGSSTASARSMTPPTTTSGAMLATIQAAGWTSLTQTTAGF